MSKRLVAIAAVVTGLALSGPVAPANAAAPTLGGTTPSHNATEVAVGANLLLNFNTNVGLGAGSIVIQRVAAGAAPITIPANSAQVTTADGDGAGALTANQVVINPTENLQVCSTYTVTVSNNAVFNASSISEYFGGVLAENWSFATVCPLTPLGVQAGNGALVGAYGIGEVIPILVRFPGTVTVTNGGANTNIKIRLNSTAADGSTDVAYSGTRSSCGAAGSPANNCLLFNYTIAAGNTPTMNVEVTHIVIAGAASLAVSGFTALTAGTSPVASPLGLMPNYAVDVTKLVATNFTTSSANGWYKAGTEGSPTTIDIAVTLNQNATHVVPAPALLLNSGGTAIYQSGTGTSTYTFRYTVGPTDALMPNMKLHVASVQNLSNFRVGGVAPGSVGIINNGGYGQAGTLSANKTIFVDNTAPVLMGSNPPVGLPVAPTLTRSSNLLAFFDGSEALRLGASKNIHIRAVSDPTTNLQTITTGAAVGIDARTRVGTTVTITTLAAHNIVNGNYVSISGIPDIDCNGIKLAAVTNATTFTYSISESAVCTTDTTDVGTVIRAASNGGALSMSSPGQLTVNFASDLLGPTAAVTSATRTGSNVVYTTDAAHGFKAPLVPTAISRTSGVITIAVASHGLIVGDQVTLAGASGTISGLNGNYAVATKTDNTFTINAPGDDIVDPTSGYGTLAYRVSVAGAGSFNANECVVSAVTTVSPHTFTCQNPGVAGTQAFNPTATAGTQVETGYFVIYDAGLVQDAAGNEVAARTALAGQAGSWVFKTGVDRMKPMAVNSNASQYFSTTGTFNIDFTETVSTGAGTPTISPAAGTLTTSVSGTTGRITFSDVLAVNTTYTLTVPLNTFTDTSENSIEGSSPLTYTFATNSLPSGGGGGGGGGTPGSCGPPPLPPCGVGPGLNFGPGGMIQNPGAIAGGDMVNLRPDNFMGFRPDDARNLGAGAMQNFRPDQFGALPPTAMAGFNRDQIANLNPAAMAGMNQTQFRALPPEAMAGFRPDQMAQLPPSAMGAFDPTRVQALPPSAMAGFNANQFAQLPPAAMAGFDPTRMQQLPPAAMAGFNANQMQQLPPAAMAGFDASKMAQLPPSAMAGFDPTKMQQLPPAAMAGFKAEQMAQLPPAAFTAFDPTKMQQLPPQAMAGFDASRMAQLPPAAVTGFKPDQFAQLPPSAMAAFDPTKMQQLPPAAVAGFQPEQMRALPPEAMRVFDPSKMQQLPPAAMAGFDPTKMQALPPTAMAVMNPNQLGQMPPAAFGAIQTQQFNVLPPTAMSGFKPELMAALPPQMVQNFKPEQFAALPPAAMGGLNEDRFRALPPQAMTAFNPQQMGAVPPQAMEAMRVAQFNVIPPTAMQGFKPDQFAALPPDAMQAFKPTQMAALPPAALAGMEPEQLRVLPPTAARALNPQQMTAVPPQALAAIPPGVFKALTPAAIAALTPEQRGAMPPQAFNPPPLPQPATAGNIGNLINSLSGWNIDKVPAAAFSGMRATDVAKLPADAFSALAPTQVGALPPTAFTAMKPNQIELLPPEAMAAMKPTQLGQLPPQALAALSPAQVGALPPAALTQMKPTQAGQLPAEAFEVMKPTQVAALPPAAMGAIKPDQVAALPPEAMTAMKPTQVAALKPTAMAALEPAQVAALPPTALTQMKPTQVAALPADALAEMKPTQVAALPPAAVGGLKPDQMAALPPEAMTTMKANQVGALKPTALAAIEPAQVDALPPAAFREVKPAQVGALPADAVKALDPAQINALPSAAFAGLKPEQAQQLTPEQAAQMKGPDLAAMPPAVRNIVNTLKG